MAALRVAVVGAGFAGLAAADALAAAGIEVVVLEARDRVGGRVWSRELENGAVVEMGAEFILPGNDTLLSYVDRFGLGLWGKDMLYGDREPRGGIGVDRRGDARRARIGSPTHCRRLAPTPRPLRCSTACRSTPARARRSGRASRSPRRQPPTASTRQRSRGSPRTRPTSARASPAATSASRSSLAAGLGSAVHLSSPVDRVSWSDDARGRLGGRRRDRGRSRRARRARERRSTGSTSTHRCRSRSAPPTQRSGTGTRPSSSSRSRRRRRRAPSSRCRSATGRWTATGADGVQPVVHSFAGSAPALARLDVADGPATWLASLARLRPDLALLPDEAVFKDWDADPWVGAAYSCDRPAAVCLGSSRPVPRLRRAHVRRELRR